MTKLIDLSQEIRHRDSFNQYPGSMPFVMPWVVHEESLKEYDGKMSFACNYLSMVEHTSTHMDSRKHVSAAPDAMSIDRCPLEWFYGPAVCLDLSHIRSQGWYSARDVEEACKKAKLEVKQGDMVLFYTGHYARTHDTPDYARMHPGPDKSVANWLADRGVQVAGFEACAADNIIDQWEKKSFPMHEVLRDRGLPVHMENLCNLDKVVNKRFTLICFPMKIRNGTGAPVRAVAVLDE